MRKVKCAVSCLVALTMVWGLSGCGVPKNQYEILEQKYERIQKEMTSFNEQVKKVKNENEALVKQNAQLGEELRKTQQAGKTISQLEEQVRKLQQDNKAIADKNQELDKQNEQLMETPKS